MSPKENNLIQVNIAVLIWGGTAMFAKAIEMPVPELTFWRSLFAAASIFVFLKIRRLPVRANSRQDLILLIGLGLCLCLHWLTYFQALKISSAAVAILALHTYPIFTALIEPLIVGARLKKTDLALAVGAFISILIMMPEINLSNRTTQGILIGILSGLFFMTRNLMIRRLVQTYPSSTLMYWQIVVTGIVLIPALFTGERPTYSGQTFLMLFLLGSFFTALPQTLYASGLKHLSARTVGILASLLPLYGAIFGYFIHSEQLSLRTAIGGGFILFCVVFENARQASENRNARKAT